MLEESASLPASPPSLFLTGDEQILSQVKEAFNSAQFGLAGHRKLIQTLRTLLLDCSRQDGAAGERSFLLGIIHCLNVLLSVKRTEEAVNRGIRFLVGLMVLAAEKDEARVLGDSNSPTVRFIENLMIYALEGLDSRDRLVRIRLAQLLVAGVNALDELSDAVWRVFRVKMTERLFDKEAAVRVQAVHAMTRLQSMSLLAATAATTNDDETITGGSGLTVLDVFLDLLAHDPSADVRKAVLYQIQVTERTLPAILERSRDVDASVRRFLYERKLGGGTTASGEEVDVRMLSIRQRDQLLRAGLRDRESAVRRACVQMVFGSWIRTTNNNLILLLLSLDVIRNVEVAEAALNAFYELVPDMFANGFPAAYFENLTPETAIALRVYCERRKQSTSNSENQENDDNSISLEELLPEMSQMAGYIKTIYLRHLGNENEDEADLETNTEDDFILRELFCVTRLLDLSDEMGRRVLQDGLVEIMGNLKLSEEVFSDALRLLIYLTTSTDDFFQACGQLLADLHEVGGLINQNPNAGAGFNPPDQLQRSLEGLSLDTAETSIPIITEDVRIVAQLRTLQLVAASFSLPNLTSFSHPALLDLLNDLVIPSINSPYAAVQTRGLHSLGLAAILCPELAIEYTRLFVDFYRQGHEEVRLTALKIIFDLLLILPSTSNNLISSAKEDSTLLNDHDIQESLTSGIITALYDSDEQVQALAAQGFAKLLLHRRCSDPLTVLVGLFQLYFHPATATNLSLRQILTFFFQAFAYSSVTHQLLIAKAFVPTLEAWLTAHHSTSQSLTPLQVAGQLIDLANPLNLIPEADELRDDSTTNEPNPIAEIGEAVAWSALHHHEDIRGKAKLYAQIFCRLPIDGQLSVRAIKRLLFLGGHLIKILATTSNETMVSVDKATQASIKRTVAHLVELDDPTIILSPEDVIELRTRLEECQLPDRSMPSNTNNNTSSTTVRRHHHHRGTTTDKDAMMNYVEDLDDLRDD